MRTRRHCRRGQAACGAAIVIVLVFVAMIMVLVLAVLGTGMQSRKQSAAVARIQEVEVLEGLPAQIVITQLQRATLPGASADGERLAWASQPGMIRVFGTQVAAGANRPAARMHYRLYSAPVMNSATLDLTQEAAALNTWSTQTAAYTDLNEPVVSHQGGGMVKQFPIADPSAVGRVAGFTLRNAAPGTSEVHPLPMPAAWIYVLRDGRLVMPANASGSQAIFAADVVTSTNPIVGRIAFWTDDESCKLNLNTASEAAAWDMPAANTQVERGNAMRAPAAVESYRISGHPAFTSLSPVLRNFGGAAAGSKQWPKPDDINPLTADSSSPWQKYLGEYQALVPHGVASDLSVRQDRHFVTVDEFFYDPKRQPNGSGAGFLMEPGDLSMARFFLTTHSAAPELNPFGGPKISLWMVPQDTSQRGGVDRRVMAGCTLNAGTSQPYEFAFQRFSNWSSTASQGSSQSMSDDWSQVQRNRELYAWLQQLSSTSIPGCGGKFLDKYGVHSRDQLLTSMLDMLRWSANTSTYLPPALGLAEQSAVPLTLDAASGPTRGFGRFPTVSEVAVVFAFTDVERGSDGQPRDDNKDGICDRATKLRAFLVVNPMMPACGAPAVSPAWSVRIRRLQHFTLGQGIGLLLPGGNVRNRCTLTSALSPSGGSTSAYACFASQFLQFDGTPKQMGLLNDPARGFPFISSGDVGLQSGMGMPGTTLRFSGGAIIVDLMAPNALLTSPQQGDAIHSVEMEFPDQAIPMPSLLVSDFANGPQTITQRFTPVMVGTEMRLPIIQRGDIVRSMVLNANGPSMGDARMVAARRELFLPEATNWYCTHPDYGTADTPVGQFKPEAQSLRDGAYMVTGQFGSSFQPTRSTAGTLLANVRFADNAIPAVPVGMTGAVGDWESGMGVLEDGPFVSRSRLLPAAAFTRGSSAMSRPATTEPLGEISSAICFGALPTGVYGDSTSSTPRPWQTLLFCPNPGGRSMLADHPGFASPPDHLWLEFFWTPVTQPWPMSTDFATEGKVNLNHQLMPFTWVQRATALHGAFKGVRITAIPTAAIDDQGDSAKGRSDGSPLDATFRYEVDEDKTVSGLNQRLDSGDVFRTASEICEQFLVPRRITGHTYAGSGFSPADPASLQAADMTTWWNGAANNASDAFEATGDNLRESPYAQLYPRLCTQSNVYGVHYRVQLLKQARSAKPNEWDETRDQVQAERRGGCVIERHLARQSLPLPDSATSSSARSLHEAQSFRILSKTPFGP
jgi:uncharacterized protein (TIGR02600 family)